MGLWSGHSVTGPQTDSLRVCCLMNGTQYVVGLGQLVALAGNFATVHGDRQLTLGTVHQLHIEIGFFPQCGRQTGGVRSDRASDRTLANDNLAHDHSSHVRAIIDERKSCRSCANRNVLAQQLGGGRVFPSRRRCGQSSEDYLPIG